MFVYLEVLSVIIFKCTPRLVIAAVANSAAVRHLTGNPECQCFVRSLKLSLDKTRKYRMNRKR